MTKKVDIEIEQKEIEAPYDLPEGWKWVRLGEYVSIVTGKKDANYGTLNGKYLFFTCAGEPLRCDDYSFSGESLLLPGNGANVGQVFYYSGNFEAYQRTYVLQRKNEHIFLKYLYYHLLAFWNLYNKDKQYGSATNYIKMGNFLEYCFPLPPTLAEQQRIVNRIESMFAKLDEANEKARNAADSFETRKAAILHQAFTGSLTAKWRKKNGVSDESWEEKKLSEVYIINPKVKADDDILASFIPMEKIEPASVNRFSFDVKYWGNIKKNHTQFQNGDVCFAKISPCFENGKAFIANGLENGIGAGTTELIILRSSEVDVRYTFYVVTNTSFVRGGCTTYSGTVGQQRISMDYVRNYKISVPTLPEQQEIVRILDTVLEKERAAKSAAEQVLEQIALLKKSILARAFRGGV